MGYSNFKTIEKVENELGIDFKYKTLFKETEVIRSSEWLKMTLLYSNYVRSKNEKSKSETIVSPILTEVVRLNADFVTFFSGSNLDVDKEKELNGECDFIIVKDTDSPIIKNAIFQITEAKEHDIKLGISQCAAQMYAAQLFNEKNNAGIDCIYGCVTTGDDWLFMKLCEKELFIDEKKYYICEPDKILGVFQTIINTFK